MNRTFVLAAVFGVISTSVWADVADEQKAAIATAIEESGCRVTAENNAVILEAAGLTQADAATVVQALIEAGNAIIEDGELVLQSGACSQEQ